MKLARGVLTATLALLLGGPIASAQNAPATPKPTTDSAAAKSDSDANAAKQAQQSAFSAHCASETAGAEHTFYLNNAVQQADANEIVTAMRNTLDPCDKVYLLPSQNAIVMRASPENMALAQKLLNDLDRPKKTYRLTYTLTEMDGGKRVGAQKFAMVAVSGQKTTLKQNSRVPVPTSSGPNPSYTYLDVGIDFDATLDEVGNGARLRSLVGQDAAVTPDKDAVIQQPVIRHITLEGASLLSPGKPMMLGSLDVPGSTRRLDVEVVMEQLP